MSNLPDLPELPRIARIAAATLLVMAATGCVRPLAVQHDYFSPLNGSIAGISMRTQHTVSRHHALQAAQHGCPAQTPPSTRPGAAKPPGGPNLGTVAAREALANLCATPARPPTAAYGATSNAYERWTEDNVRELPEPYETAAGAAGGS